MRKMPEFKEPMGFDYDGVRLTVRDVAGKLHNFDDYEVTVIATKPKNPGWYYFPGHRSISAFNRLQPEVSWFDDQPESSKWIPCNVTTPQGGPLAGVLE
jgi:hypothetical protein